MKAFITPTRSRSYWIVTKVMMVGLIVVLLLFATAGAYLLISVSLPKTSPISQASTKSTNYSMASMTSASNSDAAEVTALGTQFMDALLNQKYAGMWSLLHPQIQAMWHDQTTFTHYVQMRFENYTLLSFSLGTVGQLSSWTNPETMVQYKNVEMMPISLHMLSQLTPQQQAMLAPQFQQPDQLLKNIPFIVQRVANQSKNQWLVLKSGPVDAEAPILPPLTTASRNVNVPILMYHYISGVPVNDPDPVLRASLSVSPPLFNQQLDFLQQQGYHSITLNQLMNALYYGVPLPNKPIILTFDDGYLDAYTDAYPALKAHGFSAMFYIITGFVGQQTQMSWDQMREMLANGMQMGSHTVHHANLGLAYMASAAQVNQELQVSQTDMQNQLGISIQHFCYPFGSPFTGNDTTLQQNVVGLLAANGYIDAVTDPGPTGVTQSSTAPFVLLRLRNDGRSSLQDFMNMLQAYA
jgi:peptidoglycan/xylan/chitin deacetylase (PgdA/CDA1 family)